MKKWSQLFLLTSLGFLTYLPIFAESTSNKSPIEITSIFNLSGSQKDLDQASFHGAQVAVQEINSQGGVLGRELKLTNYDGKSDLKELNKISNLIASDAKQQLILGLNDNDTLMAVAPEILSQGKIFISPGATSPLFNALFSRQLFLISFTDEQQAIVGANYAYHNLKQKEVGILFDQKMFYAITLASYFSSAFKTYGGTIKFALPVPIDNPKANAFDEKIKKLIQQNSVSFIYLAADPATVPRYINLLREMNYKGVIMGGDSYVPDEIIKNAKNSVDNIYFTALRIMSESAKFPVAKNQSLITDQFLSSYKKAFPKETLIVNSALGYDSIKLLVHGIEIASSTNPIDIQKALRNQATSFTGTTGALRFTHNFINPPERMVTIYAINKNKTSLVWTKECSSPSCAKKK